MTEPTNTGRLSDLIRKDGIASVCCHGQEILRRIFVTVRDRHWKEIPPSYWESELDDGRRSATLTARHSSDSVDFKLT